VERIEAGMFSSCSSLLSISIPESVKSIEFSAFVSCTSLASITIPDSVQTIGMEAFQGCTRLASVTFPDSMQSIGRGAFQRCAFTSVTFPRGVKNLEGSVFSSCSSLVSITLPEGVEIIGSTAFEGCFALTSLTIPASVTSLEGAAFRSSGVRTFTFEGMVAPALSNYDPEHWQSHSTFLGIPSTGTLYYPEGATGYTENVFKTYAELPSGWRLVAVAPDPGAPGSGDLNGDGTPTAGEALQVARAVISGSVGWSAEKIAAADMDNDGVLTMADVVRILRKAAGLS
jgi:hypothetical protein